MASLTPLAVRRIDRPTQAKSLSSDTDLSRADARRNRERILKAAQRLLEQSPVATLGDIAAAAGVSRATLYRRFGSRAELIRALRESPGGGDEQAAAATLPA